MKTKTVISKRRLYYQKYRRENKEKIRLWRKKYYQTEKYKSWARSWRKKYLRKLRIKVINQFGGKCVNCGFNDWRALQIDHINGGGRKDPEVLKKTYSYHKYLLKTKDINKYQLLCANCNWIKKYQKGEV